MRRLRATATFLALGAAAVWACAVYDSSLLVGGGSDAGPDVDAGPDGCVGERPPPRPSADDPTSDPDLDLILAVSGVDLGLDGGARLSVNLDGKCTCPEVESCKPRIDAPKHCDDDAGRDNSAGPLLSRFALLSSQFDPTGVNKRIAEGGTGLLVHIRRWNGTPNDRSIELSMLTSLGTRPTSDAGDAGNPLPKHDGTDEWIAAASSLQGGSGPPYVSKYVDSNAYVAGGVLVGLLDFPLALTGGFSAAFLQLRGTYVIARLDKDSRGWSLRDGRMTGRWDMKNLLSSMQVVDDPLNPGQFLCGANVTYQALKKEICKSADIMSNPANDGTDIQCDAISLGVGFEAEPAILNGWQDNAKQGKTPCGPNYTDTCE